MSRAEISTLVTDTNILLLLIGYQCLEFQNATGPRRGQTLAAIRGRSDNLPPERFDDLWQVFQWPNGESLRSTWSRKHMD
jgi:hypothetical protein